MKPLQAVSLCLLLALPNLVLAQKAGKQNDPFQHPFANPVDQPDLPRVLIVGDSISIGYTPRVRKLLDGVANVHRPKTNCRWSAFGDEHIEEWVGDGDWDVIHFNFGLWDWYGWRQEVKATPESYAKSLESIVLKMRKKTDAKLIFAITTPPCIAAERNAHIVVTEQRAREFNKAALEVMGRHKVGINNLYDVIGKKRAQLQKGANDVHYTEEGRDLLAGVVAKRIQQELSDLSRSSPCRTPNIIFLFADDQRADTIGAHGNAHIHTPNLDKLAANGFSFRKNYCAGSFSGAVCVASRAMLMTGRHWMNLPAQRPNTNWGDSVTLPSLLLEKANYETFIVGKWHNGKGTLDKSFTNGRAVYMGGMANHADFQVQDLEGGQLTPKRDAGGFSSTVFADEAVSFIEDAKSDKPFFLYVAFMAPHDPRNPPEKYRQRYYKNRPPLPPNYLPTHPFQNAPQVTMGRDESLAPWPRTKAVISDQLCEYYGLVTHLDEQVGRILSALKQSPHASNTLVVYTADHGLAMGSHGLLGKQNVYEQSMQCPLILSGPGVPKGKSSHAFTYIHDLYSTLCETAKVQLPPKVDGKSLLPILQGKSEKVRDSLFLPFQDNQRSVSDGKWKLHVYPQINHRLLFNLSTDPHELHNLAANPAHQDTMKEMETLMGKWRTRLGDPYPLSVNNPLDKTPKFNNETRVLDRWQPKWIRDKYFDGRDNPNHGLRKKPQKK